MKGKQYADTKNLLLSKIEIFYLFIFFFYYSYVHTRLGSFLPPAPTPSLSTHSAPSLSPPPQYPAESMKIFKIRKC
jgi:hypothetical protein